MNLVITGATGNLGMQLLTSLRTQKGDISLFCVGRRKPTEVFSSSIRFLHANFPDVLPNEQSVPEYAIYVHVAGLTHTCNPAEYFRVNTDGTRAFLAFAQKRTCKHFIFISTRAIHPSGGAYAQSKRAAENLVAESKLPHTILRFSEVYGDGSEGISRIIEKVRKNRTVLLPGDGSDTVAPLFIQDAIRAIILIIDTKPKNKVVTITGPESMSLNTFVVRTAKYLGKTPLIFHIPKGVFRLLVPFVCLLPNPPFFPDQLARLSSPKEISSRMTLRWLKPVTIEEGLRYGKTTA